MISTAPLHERRKAFLVDQLRKSWRLPAIIQSAKNLKVNLNPIGRRYTRLHSPWLILVFFIFVQIPFLLQPIEGRHMSRQADTAGVARNLAFESFDPIRPRIDLRGDKSGIVGMEFPLYQMVVAGGLGLIGDHDVVGKLVSLLAMVVAWILLARLLGHRAGIDPWAAQAALGACPILLIYAAKVMPETSALLLSIVALQRFDAHRMQARQAPLWQGVTALTLAALTRPYVIFIGLPLIFFWVGEYRKRRIGFEYLAAAAALILPFLLWYFVWWPHLECVYGLDYFFAGTPLSENIGQMLAPAFWSSLLNTIIKFYLNWLCFPFALLGGMILWHARSRIPDVALMALWLPAVTVPVLCLLIGDQFVSHEYYFLALVPWSVLLVAVALDRLRERHPRLGIATCVLVAVLTPGLFWKQYRSNNLLPAYQAVTTEITLRTHKNDLVLIEAFAHDPLGAWYLHPIRRRGWIERHTQLYNRENVVNLRRRGLRWVIWYGDSKYHLTDVDTWVNNLEAQS
jgi:hypothetical protein